jgi:hypothetical protein
MTFIKHKPKFVWPPAKKREVAETYALTGSVLETAAITKVPANTVRFWKDSVWFQELMRETSREELFEVATKAHTVMKKALKASEDRLDNGNYILNQKTGLMERIPPPLKDTVRATTDLMGKREKLLQAASEQKTEDTVDRLSKLAEELARFAQAKAVPAIEGQVIESSSNHSVADNSGDSVKALPGPVKPTMVLGTKPLVVRELMQQLREKAQQ